MVNKGIVNIVGGGVGGLFSAYLLLNHGYKVNLYEQMGSLGKKFLVAGNGGLNLTHSEETNLFSKRYGENRDLFEKYIQVFSPEDLRKFCSDLGVETFIGSSGRVFPKELKAAQLLSRWVDHLKVNPNFSLYLNHRLKEIKKNQVLVFEFQKKQIEVERSTTIFSLGGGSWKSTGSDGLWIQIFNQREVGLTPLTPVNCGFTVSWSDHICNKESYQHLKNIKISISDTELRGEMMITPYGVEGGLIYSLSSLIQKQIKEKKTASLSIDLLPDHYLTQVEKELLSSRGKNSISNFLRKKLNISGAKFLLLKECTTKEEFNSPLLLAKKIKELTITLNNSRPIDEAISTAGGINFSELDDSLMIKSLPDFYVIGEMVNWEAPTGGYLLQGCFSTAFWAVSSIIST